MARREFHEAFAEALTRRNVSLAWLHQRLVERGRPVSVTALSYWRSGRSQPERGTSLEALDEIERLLGERPGSLSSLIGPSRRPGPAPAELSSEVVFKSIPGIMPALSQLGFKGLYDELNEQLRHLTVDVDRDGRMCAVDSRTMLQARHDGARRMPLVVTADDAGRMARFVPLAGCSLGQQVFDEENGVYAVELLVDRTLTRGESCLYELRVEFPEPSSDAWFDHFSARRIGELMLWVRFHPDRLPTIIERYEEDDNGRETTEKLDLGGGHAAHALARGFGPGILGIRWTW